MRCLEAAARRVVLRLRKAPATRRRRGTSGTVILAAGTESPTRRDRLLSRYWLWRARRDWSRQLRKHDLPRFYRQAKQSDVHGLVVPGPSGTVGDCLPEGFEAYVRLPNPFWKVVPAQTETAILHRADSGDSRDTWVEPVPCAAVAEENGLRMTHETRWGQICGPHDGHLAASPDQAWSWAPRECDLDPVRAARLFALLGSETGPRDRCLCGKWEGGSSEWDTDVLLVTPYWNYFVWRARFRDVAEWLQQPDSYERHLHVPHVVWPADRRWFLATLYSGCSNYLAGSRPLIDTVLASGLEAYEVRLADEAH